MNFFFGFESRIFFLLDFFFLFDTPKKMCVGVIKPIERWLYVLKFKIYTFCYNSLRIYCLLRLFSWPEFKVCLCKKKNAAPNEKRHTMPKSAFQFAKWLIYLNFIVPLPECNNRSNFQSIGWKTHTHTHVDVEFKITAFPHKFTALSLYFFFLFPRLISIQ